MIYKGEAITITCCDEPMKALGPWPHGDTKILVSKFFCFKCKKGIEVIEPDFEVVDGQERRVA